MDLSPIAGVRETIKRGIASGGMPADERAVWENFHFDERVGAPRSGEYVRAFGMSGSSPVSSMGDYSGRHRNLYLDEAVFLEKTDPRLPHTFDSGLNGQNFWPDIDDNVALYRMESSSFALSDAGLDESEFERHVLGWCSPDPGKRESARPLLQRVLGLWNARRDRRPLFATTHDEISGLLDSAGDNWANELRDHLGLGHYNPSAGRSETVLLLRYTARDVRAAGGGHQAFCVPTVLDGTLNPCFHPTPLPGLEGSGSEWTTGRAVNLAPVSTESDYAMHCELIHSYLDYRPEYLVRLGRIDRPVSGELPKLRGFHLNWLRLLTDRNESNPYGTDLSYV